MAFTALKSSLLSFPFSVLLLHHLLFLSAAVAQREDIFNPFGLEACSCCDVSQTSRCCATCLQRAVFFRTSEDREGEPSAVESRFLREVAESYLAARDLKNEGEEEEKKQKKKKKSGEEDGESDSFLQSWRQWSESAGQMCRCCRKTLGLSPVPWLRLLGQACCSLCGNAYLQTPPGKRHLAPSPLRHDVSGDVGKGMSSPVKRMTSMDCMCCMNSGISDCCSKCRIF